VNMSETIRTIYATVQSELMSARLIILSIRIEIIVV
jgi:hypothetical protein